MIQINPFEALLPARLLYGPGRLSELGELASPLGDRALLITGGGSVRRNGLLERATSSLQSSGVSWELYEGISGNPRASEADAAGEALRESRANMVIGLGGGSVLDVAKAAALVAAYGPPVHRFLRKEDSAKEKHSAPPVIAVPTIAGTGSEFNDTVVLTDEGTGAKGSLRGPACVPRLSILDPHATATAPTRTAVASGLDALCHALEAYVGTRNNLLSDAFARAGADLLVAHLPHLPEGDERARGAVLVGAALAGQALSLSASLVTHPLEHPLSAHLDAHHGEGVGALEPAVFERVWEGAPQRFAEISAWLGGERSPEAAADSFRRFARGVGFERGVRDLGMKEEHAGPFADEALASGSRGFENTPVRLGRADLLSIYHAAFAG